MDRMSWHHMIEKKSSDPGTHSKVPQPLWGPPKDPSWSFSKSLLLRCSAVPWCVCCPSMRCMPLKPASLQERSWGSGLEASSFSSHLPLRLLLSPSGWCSCFWIPAGLFYSSLTAWASIRPGWWALIYPSWNAPLLVSRWDNGVPITFRQLWGAGLDHLTACSSDSSLRLHQCCVGGARDLSWTITI